MQNVCSGAHTTRADGENGVSRPEVMTAAGVMTTDGARLATQIGYACFEQGQSDLIKLGGTMLARGLQSLLSTNLLAQKGLVGDAMSCSRTIVEMAIDFAYIGAVPSRVERFMSYGGVAHHKLARNIAQFGGDIPTEVLATLETYAQRFRTENPDGSLGNWSGQTLEARAAEGLRAALYRLSYSDQCNASHSGPGTLAYAMVANDQGFGAHFGPMQPSARPVMLALTGLLALMGEVVQRAGLEPRFAEAVLALSARVKEIIEPAPPGAPFTG